MQRKRTPIGAGRRALGAALVCLGLVPAGPAAASFVEPHRSSRASVWAVGDGADGSQASRGVARMIARHHPDRFLYLGDVYHSGTAAEFDSNYRPIYGRFDSIAAPTPGNHEWANRHQGYYPYWAQVKGASTPNWYAFRVGRWQILSLNSEASHSADSRQLRWLRRRLRSTRRFGTCRIAFWHRPRYSAGDHGDSEDVAPLWRALSRRARLVLNGHDHDMQRHRRRDGVTTLISGAGGHDLRSVDEDDPRLAFGAGGQTGALRLLLRRRRARSTFFTGGGEVLDRDRFRCRREARSP